MKILCFEKEYVIGLARGGPVGLKVTWEGCTLQENTHASHMAFFGAEWVFHYWWNWHRWWCRRILSRIGGCGGWIRDFTELWRSLPIWHLILWSIISPNECKNTMHVISESWNFKLRFLQSSILFIFSITFGTFPVIESPEQASAAWNSPCDGIAAKGSSFEFFQFNNYICPSTWPKFMHDLFCIPDDLNISGIIAAVVVVALVISVCGLGVCYAQRKGYFSSKWISPFFARQLPVDI